MADNTTLSAAVGSGDSIATDDIGGVKYPRSKIVIGADGTNDGDVSSANPLPASLRSEQVDDAVFTPATSRVTMVGATFDDSSPDSVNEGDGGAVRMSANRNLYATIRDAAGNERGLNVDASGNIGITDASGSLTVDGTVAISGTVAVTDNSGSLTVDGTVTANAGSGTFVVGDGGSSISVDDNSGSLTVDGTVTATLSSSTNAGAAAKTADYDSGAGTDTVTMFGMALPASGGAVAGGTSTNPIRTDPTGTTAQPITDNSGSLTVDDGAGSLTVDGTVTANAGSGTFVVGDGGSSISIDDNSGSITVDGTVTANAGSGTFTVSGTVAVSSLPASTGTLEVVGDVAHDAVSAGNPVLIGAYAKATAPTDVSADGDAVRIWADLAGRVQVGDGGSTLSVDDGAGSLTVDGTVAISGTVAVTDNSGSLTVDGTVAVSSVTTSVTPGTSAAHLGKAEDAVHGSGDTGVMALGVRNDAGTALAADGDYIPLSIDSSGAVRVTGGGGGTQYTEADTDASITGTAVLWEDTSDTLRTVSAAKPLPVNVVAGSTSGTEYTEGDTDVSISGTAILWEDGSDTLRAVSAAKPLPIGDAGGSLTVDGTVAVSALPASTNTIEVVGDVAHDAVAAGNPVLVGAYAKATAPTDVSADGDAVRIWADLAGRVQVGDGGGLLSVDDGAGSLTVDGTVAVSSVTTSVTPGTSAAHLGKAEDAVHSSGDTGVMALAVRSDTAAATGADGDYVPLLTDSAGKLHVNVGNTVTVGSHAVTNAGTFAVQESGSALTSLQLIDDVVFAEDLAASSGDKGVQVLAVRRDTAASSSTTDGDYSTINTDASGRLWVNASGAAVPVTDNSGSLTVDNGGTFAVQVDGSALTSLQLIDDVVFAEDAAAVSGDKGVQVLAVRRDAAASSSTTDGDYSTLNTDASGRLWVNASGAAVPVTDNSGSLTVDNGGTFAVQDSEKIADDAAFTVATTKVVPVGFLADETATDSVDEGDIGAARMTLDRKLRTTQTPHTAGGLSIFRTLDADETEEDVKTSAGQLYGWYLSNTGAAVVFVKFYNATAANTTVGSTTPILTLMVPAGGAANLEMANGLVFDTALCVAATTLVADNDATAPSANQVVANIWYK